MPFKSKAQMRFFFAKEKKGEFPKGTAQKWADETPNISKLPEHVKKACQDHFIKIAAALFDQKRHPPITALRRQKDMIAGAKQQKMKGMSPVEYRNDLTQKRTGTIARNKQSAKSA